MGPSTSLVVRQPVPNGSGGISPARRRAPPCVRMGPNVRGYRPAMAHENLPRLAIVTGADSGIGQATAKLLATEGFDVGATFHTDADGIRATTEEVEKRGQRCVVEKFDAEAPDAGAVVDRLAEQLGGVGV